MSSSPSTKRARTSKDVPYELIYWPGIPGRGEHVRLVLEEAGALYTDTAHQEGGIKGVLSQIDAQNLGDEQNPPPLAPPVLRHGELVLSQTPNILLYLGERLGLAGNSGDEGDNADADARFKVNALALTALDGLSNEPHECHHPVAVGLYYEDQKAEAKRRGEDYVKNSLPKFVGYFERVLKGQASGGGEYLHGGKLTYADLVLFQCLNGVEFMFPKAVKKLRDSGEYRSVFEHYEAVQNRPKIKEYLASDRRQKYSQGIYRYYEELDIEP